MTELQQRVLDAIKEAHIAHKEKPVSISRTAKRSGIDLGFFRSACDDLAKDHKISFMDPHDGSALKKEYVIPNTNPFESTAD